MRPSTLAAALQLVALAWAAPPPAQKPSLLAAFTDKVKGFVLTVTAPGKAPPPRQCGLSTKPFDASRPGFDRFEWVVGKRLARSSAPHYRCRDSDQRLTPASIEFLKKNKISHVISLNSAALDSAIRDKLYVHGIDYTPVPVVDYQTPSMPDFLRAYRDFTRHQSGRTLVWCGYGHGRTGTMITALQMFMAHEGPSPKKFTRDHYRKNHVETETQAQMLDHIQKVLFEMRR